MTARGPKTPIRRALEGSSPLQPQVQDGIDALGRTDRRLIDGRIRGAFGDSLDLDESLRQAHPRENRWDYLLGHTPSARLIGLEPHPARQADIRRIIQKKEAARRQLAEHLKVGVQVADWLWVASGDVCFADTERVRRVLDQRGIRFVGRKVLARHLPPAVAKGRPD